MKHRKSVTVLLALLMLFILAASCTAADRTLIRVGFVSEPIYNIIDATGKHHGYADEILHNIAMHAGLDIKYVSFTNYGDEDAALKDGRIDLELTVPKSAAREKEFLFSEVPTGHLSLVLVIRDDDGRYSYGDQRAVNGMRVAVAKGDAVADTFREWCAESNLRPIIKTYPDTESAVAAVRNREADSYAVGFNATYSGFHTLLGFRTAPFYIMMNKNNTALALKINTALREIMIENPMYEQELYSKYMSSGHGNSGALTNHEKKFLAERGRKLTVALQKYDPPFSYESRSGAMHGIIPDYYSALSNKLGITFSMRSFDTQAEAIAAVRQGKADIAGFYGGDVCNGYSDGLSLVAISDLDDMTVISRFGRKGTMRAAVLKRSNELLSDSLLYEGDKRCKLYLYDNIEECYKAFKDNTVNSIVCTTPMATWLVNNHRMSGCAIVPFMNMRYKLYSAVDRNNGVLYSLLNKSVISTNSLMQSAITSNTMPRGDLRSTLERIPESVLAIFAAILFVMVVLLIVLLVLFGHRHKERAAMAAKQAENEIAMVRLESLEKSNEDRDMFFSNISHDMRTPLNGIVGFTNLALSSSDVAQMHDYMHKIAISSTLLVDLIDDTLTISKLNSGKLEQQNRPVDAGKIFEEIITPVRETAAAKNITFIVDTAQMDDKIIIADELSLKKIFLNLLSNSVKYTPEGGTVEFHAADSSNTKDSVDLTATVRDTGIGIAPKFMSHLYEPFMQEDRAAKMSAGTGLGMNIVKRLIDIMGGSIMVRSEIDNGTEFTVHLRFQRAEGAAAAAPADPETDLSVLRGKKILLCEDNQLNREIVQAILQNNGMSVVSAEDGHIGVGIFAASRPGEISVILMDVRMPEMNGFEATKAIRAMARQDSKVPIIALTANAYESDINECFRAGMDSHIAKPVDSAKLLSEIAKFCCMR